MMTIDEVIAKLESFKTTISGSSIVVVQCPVQEEDCWLHPENIRMQCPVQEEACWLHPENIRIENAPDEQRFVRIAGGSGA